jgi:hypothetical protein
MHQTFATWEQKRHRDKGRAPPLFAEVTVNLPATTETAASWGTDLRQCRKELALDSARGSTILMRGQSADLPNTSAVWKRPS